MSKRHPTLPAVIAAANATEDPELLDLIDRATPTQRAALISALRSAYEAGQEEADQRTGRLMARIFGGFIGVTPGVDLDVNGHAMSPRERIRSMVRMLTGGKL